MRISNGWTSSELIIQDLTLDLSSERSVAEIEASVGPSGKEEGNSA